ncbi:hypothetical protein QF117_10435 [Vibrio sp. YMD68]|uniref:hypothetical protein n=1 Tax=Vibrio sp. YMD68 TaxID=3042300 RepID=UPI00249C3390|nr:hypothetical protein [Vibrio sp. YMD68]WGW01209.1 hypothetical protein QF117_10435 [Vibrio sp. YMD68]
MYLKVDGLSTSTDCVSVVIGFDKVRLIVSLSNIDESLINITIPEEHYPRRVNTGKDQSPSGLSKH